MEPHARTRQYADHLLNHLEHLNYDNKLSILQRRITSLEDRFRLYLIINGVILVGYLAVVLV